MRLRRFCAAPLLAALACAAQAAALKVTLLERADDPRLARDRTERAYLGQPGGSAADALAMAFKDAQFELDAAGTTFTLDRVAVADAAGARAAAAKAHKAGHAALVAELPADWLLAAADAAPLAVLNVGDASDRLREKDCRANTWHLVPSERMRSDALAQTLLGQRWSQALLLVGPSAADAERAATAQASIKRYGLKPVQVKPFKLSADPRERELANPLLLTSAAAGAYDLVWVVDSDGEFARGLPYRTALPRPVVGDGGLAALAWHVQFERFGAPQLSRRFAKTASRPMTAHDWAAWMAGKALVEAAIALHGQGDARGRKPAAAQAAPTAAALTKALGTLELDGYKGTTLSFRAWDGQLRQPLLLTDGQGVVAMAPQDAVLHPKNKLDTLGADQPEKLCKTPR